MSGRDIGYARTESGLDWQQMNEWLQLEAEIKIDQSDDDVWVLPDQAWTQLIFYARQPDGC